MYFSLESPCFQKGHAYITEKGYDLLALASIAGVKNKKITWADE